MDNDHAIEQYAKKYLSPNLLMTDWVDLTVEHSPLGILTMYGFYRGVRYEETLHLTNFEVSAAMKASKEGNDVVEQAVVRLMHKLKSKPTWSTSKESAEMVYGNDTGTDQG